MKKAVIVYWSGTGNTQIMAQGILSGLNEQKVKAELYNVSDANIDYVADFDNIILGSPAMGDEEVENEEFAPFLEQLMYKIKNKNIALFGSYGWGDGAWLEKWEKKLVDAGHNLIIKSLALYSTPSTEEEEKCKLFGEQIASNLK